LSQAELEGRPSPFIDQLFGEGFQRQSFGRLGPELARRIVAGGYPAALERPRASRRAAWYHDYLETVLQRDVRDLARIHALEALPRLLQLAATQTARLVNMASLATAFQLSRPTIDTYVTLLERLFLLEEIPPWHTNQLSRLIKSPKLHLGDTGIAGALLGVPAETLHDDRPLLGQLLETFVYQELRRQASGRDDRLAFYHFRDKDGAEVDLVLERGALQLAGVEVKAAASVQEADFRGLRKLRTVAGPRFRGGVVLYDGEHLAGFGDRLFAVPLRCLWENL
jgi:predicted AAA+ superfamily ATPase